VTRAEEGEERTSPTVQSNEYDRPPHNTYHQNSCENDHRSPAQQSLYRSYEELERERERDRYEDYLDERDGEKMPNAFNLGWRLNLLHLFGENVLLWPLPVCTTTGDGWHWEPSSKWLEAKRKLERQRAERREEALRQGQQQQQQQNQRPPPQYGGWHADRIERFGADASIDTGRDLDEVGGGQRPTTIVSMKMVQPKSSNSRAGEHDFEENETSDRFSTSSSEDDNQPGAIGERPLISENPTGRGVRLKRHKKKSRGTKLRRQRRNGSGDGEWRDWN